MQGALLFDLMKGFVFSDLDDIYSIYKIIFDLLKSENIHPNDVSIISTNIEFLRKLDLIIRTESNEKTQTTFESEEVYLQLKSLHKENNSKLAEELEHGRGSKKI